MARIRFVKPEFFSDAKLVRLRPVVRLFYVGLFTQADRDGRFIWNPGDLNIKIIPYDRTSADECLAELLEIGRVFRYGKHGEFGLIINFLKHQYINPREPASKIPPPEKSPIPNSYQTDTGILDKGIRNKDKREEKHDSGKPESSISYLKNIPIKDLWEFYQRFDCTKKALASKGEDLWNYCKSKGKIYRDYKALFLNAIKKDFPERRSDDRIRNSKLVEVDGIMKILPPELQAEAKKLSAKMKIKDE